jgi:hypothetical protein
VGRGDAWSADRRAALAAAYTTVRPSVKDFWAHVAKLVPGKTAQECHDEHTRAFPTPAAVARKADDRRRRPGTPKAGAGAEAEEEDMDQCDDGLTFSSSKVRFEWGRGAQGIGCRRGRGSGVARKGVLARVSASLQVERVRFQRLATAAHVSWRFGLRRCAMMMRAMKG